MMLSNDVDVSKRPAVTWWFTFFVLFLHSDIFTKNPNERKQTKNLNLTKVLKSKLVNKYTVQFFIK